MRIAACRISSWRIASGSAKSIPTGIRRRGDLHGLQRLNGLYANAMEFYRRHGRLPGAVPVAAVLQRAPGRRTNGSHFCSGRIGQDPPMDFRRLDSALVRHGSLGMGRRRARRGVPRRGTGTGSRRGCGACRCTGGNRDGSGHSGRTRSRSQWRTGQRLGTALGIRPFVGRVPLRPGQRLVQLAPASAAKWPRSAAFCHRPNGRRPKVAGSSRHAGQGKSIPAEGQDACG